MEIGVALWFPCVLWNCIRPEQLWCLNPKKILERMPPLGGGKRKRRKDADSASAAAAAGGFKEEADGGGSGRSGGSQSSTEDDGENVNFIASNQKLEKSSSDLDLALVETNSFSFGNPRAMSKQL